MCPPVPPPLTIVCRACDPSSRPLGILVAPIIGGRGVSRILGEPLIARGRSNGRNSYLAITCIEGLPSGPVNAGDATVISGLALVSIGFGSHIRHYKTPCIGLWIKGLIEGEWGGNGRRIVPCRDIPAIRARNRSRGKPSLNGWRTY